MAGLARPRKTRHCDWVMASTVTLRSSAPRPQFPACPECALGMNPYACAQTVVFKCDKCHGLWFTGRRLGIFRRSLATFDFSTLDIYVNSADDHKYVISSCQNCRQLLDKIPYGYNSGVSLFRRARCQGLWLPLRQIIQLMQSLQLGQSIADDVHAFVVEMKKANRDLQRLVSFVLFWRRLTR
jgi:Zn-finger nucleic acid-binding protein